MKCIAPPLSTPGGLPARKEAANEAVATTSTGPVAGVTRPSWLPGEDAEGVRPAGPGKATRCCRWAARDAEQAEAPAGKAAAHAASADALTLESQRRWIQHADRRAGTGQIEAQDGGGGAPTAARRVGGRLPRRLPSRRRLAQSVGRT